MKSTATSWIFVSISRLVFYFWQPKPESKESLKRLLITKGRAYKTGDRAQHWHCSVYPGPHEGHRRGRNGGQNVRQLESCSDIAQQKSLSEAAMHTQKLWPIKFDFCCLGCIFKCFTVLLGSTIAADRLLYNTWLAGSACVNQLMACSLSPAWKVAFPFCFNSSARRAQQQATTSEFLFGTNVCGRRMPHSASNHKLIKNSCVACGQFRRTVIAQISKSVCCSHSRFTREADTQSVATFNVKLHVRGCKETGSVQPFQKALHLRQHKCLNVFKADHLRDEVEQIELCAVVDPVANLECSTYLGPLPSKGRPSRRHLGSSETQK